MNIFRACSKMAMFCLLTASMSGKGNMPPKVSCMDLRMRSWLAEKISIMCSR